SPFSRAVGLYNLPERIDSYEFRKCPELQLLPTQTRRDQEDQPQATSHEMESVCSFPQPRSPVKYLCWRRAHYTASPGRPQAQRRNLQRRQMECEITSRISLWTGQAG